MNEIIKYLKEYQLEMVDQFNWINKTFHWDEQTEETRATTREIAIRVECLEKTIKFLELKMLT